MTTRLARPLAAALAASLLVSACSGDADDAPSSTSSASSGTADGSASSTASSSPEVRVTGAPARLREAVATRYGGTEVRGTAKLGRWRGQRVAVVTADEDVTLAVEAKGGSSWRVVGGWWPSLGQKGAEDLGGRRHVLVIGSDARPGETPTRTRADALQLLGVDGKGGAGLMGFARDLWVPIPGHGSGKLNSALVYAGPDGQTQAVSDLTGIDVGGYVVTGFDGFTSIVDELGGLTFVAPFDMRSGLAGGKIAKGRHTLSGREALAWARERKSLPGGDFDRSRNQGLLLAAAALQARVEGPGKVPRALSVIDKHAESDLSAEEMLLFTASFYRVQPTKVGHTVAKGPTGMQSGQSIVRLDAESRAAFRDFRDGRLS